MTREELLRDPTFATLKELLIGRTGLAYFADRDEDLADRVVRRMVRVSAGNGAAYVALLRSPYTGAAELEAVTAELTIGETYFFRYHEQFDALRDRVIPELIERRTTTRTLRFWSAGCASGPEPYSLAILLKQRFGARLAGWSISIVGSDLNHEFLTRARTARYSTWALRTLTDEQRSAAFAREGEDWTVRPEFREGVSFVRHNLVEDPLPSYQHGLYGFDVILCRNVMIYFDRRTIAATVERLRGCLSDDGWLFVGHSEPNLEVFRSWETVPVPGATLYRNRGTGVGGGEWRVEGGGWRVEGGERAYGASESPPLPQSPTLPGTGLDSSFIPHPASFPKPPTSPGADSDSSLILHPSSFPDDSLENLRTLANSAQWGAVEDLSVRLEDQERLNPLYHFYRALAAEGLGKIEDAERCYRQTLFLDRGHAPAHYHLGLLLESRGEIRQAERAYRNAAGILAKASVDEPTGEGNDVTAGELRHVVELRLARLTQRKEMR